jgi:hypothetical protein
MPSAYQSRASQSGGTVFLGFDFKRRGLTRIRIVRVSLSRFTVAQLNWLV